MEAVHYRGEARCGRTWPRARCRARAAATPRAASVLQTGVGRPIAVPTLAHEEAARRADLLRAGRAPTRPSRCAAGSACAAPAGTPDEIVQKLSDLMVEGGKTERIQKILTTFGIDDGAHDHAYFEK